MIKRNLLSSDTFNFLLLFIKLCAFIFNISISESKIKNYLHTFCFRFLATGNSFKSIGFNFKLGFSTVPEIVKEVCDAIWNRLGPIVMPPPREDMWKSVASKYKTMWHFPNCIGAIDEKHINI